MFSFYRNYFHVRDYYGTLMITELIKTELSTLFMVFDYWIPKKYTLLRGINGFAFVISFFKFRIYDLFYSIATNQELFTHMSINIIDGSLIGYTVCFGAFYVLYALNVYWFMIILKKFYKALFAKYDSYINAEYILQHSYVVCLVICLYIYLFENPADYQKIYSMYYYYDTVGIAILVIFSGIYHASNYYSLVNEGENFNCMKYPNVVCYLMDNFAIRLRVFMTLLTNTLIRSVLGHPDTDVITYLAGGANLLSGLLIAMISIYLNQSQVNYTFSLNNTITVQYAQILQFIGAVPIVLCTFFMSMGVNDLNLLVHNYMVIYLLVLVSVMCPFYKMNHVLIHVVLMYQTWVLCKINASF
jgi:hypothetical protein